MQVRVGKRSSGRPIVLLMSSLKDDVTLSRGSVHLNRYQLECIEAVEGDALQLQVVPFGSDPPLATLELFVELMGNKSITACMIKMELVGEVFKKTCQGQTLRLGQRLCILVARDLPIKITGMW